jgi:hypothetical protein
MPSTCSSVRIAVTLSENPSWDKCLTSGSADSPRVLVIGILT